MKQPFLTFQSKMGLQNRLSLFFLKWYVVYYGVEKWNCSTRKRYLYTIYIKSITLTSSLKKVVLYEVWTGHKPDVSYLQISGSLG